MESSELKSVAGVVKETLKDCERSRNSDSILYLKVLQHYADKSGLALHKISVPYFLLNMDKMGFPGFETVRRTRQMAQRKNPELAACEKVEGFRAENEKVFKEYALGDAR